MHVATKDAELSTIFQIWKPENKTQCHQRGKNITTISSLEKEVAITVGIVGQLNSKQETGPVGMW